MGVVLKALFEAIGDKIEEDAKAYTREAKIEQARIQGMNQTTFENRMAQARSDKRAELKYIIDQLPKHECDDMLVYKLNERLNTHSCQYDDILAQYGYSPEDFGVQPTPLDDYLDPARDVKNRYKLENR